MEKLTGLFFFVFVMLDRGNYEFSLFYGFFFASCEFKISLLLVLCVKRYEVMMIFVRMHSFSMFFVQFSKFSISIYYNPLLFLYCSL